MKNWSIVKTPEGVRITAPDGCPGGMTVTGSERSLPGRLLHDLALAVIDARADTVESMLAAYDATPELRERVDRGWLAGVLEKLVGAPVGWVLVPVELTQQMLDALRTGSRKDYPSDELCRVRWAALLAAVRRAVAGAARATPAADPTCPHGADSACKECYRDAQQLEAGCKRSHPHENMDAACEAATVAARAAKCCGAEPTPEACP